MKYFDKDQQAFLREVQRRMAVVRKGYNKQIRDLREECEDKIYYLKSYNNFTSTEPYTNKVRDVKAEYFDKFWVIEERLEDLRVLYLGIRDKMHWWDIPDITDLGGITFEEFESMLEDWFFRETVEEEFSREANALEMEWCSTSIVG